MINETQTATSNITPPVVVREAALLGDWVGVEDSPEPEAVAPVVEPSAFTHMLLFQPVGLAEKTTSAH